MYIAKLDDNVNKCNSTCHSKIKMKPVDVKSTSINFYKKNKKEDPKFKVGDHVKMSKYKIFLEKVTFRIGLKKKNL